MATPAGSHTITRVPAESALFDVLSGAARHEIKLHQHGFIALLDAIRTKLSARHVPNDVFAIPDVPRTISGKKMEVPIKKILLGQPPEKSANRDSMGNPGSIDWFVGFAAGRGVDAG